MYIENLVLSFTKEIYNYFLLFFMIKSPQNNIIHSNQRINVMFCWLAMRSMKFGISLSEEVKNKLEKL